MLMADEAQLAISDGDDRRRPRSPIDDRKLTDDGAWPLKAPVENDHAAFCCGGCFTRFYRRRCLVCERDLSDPMTGEAVKLGRKFCGQKCQREHRRFPRVYSV